MNSKNQTTFMIQTNKDKLSLFMAQEVEINARSVSISIPFIQIQTPAPTPTPKPTLPRPDYRPSYPQHQTGDH